VPNYSANDDTVQLTQMSLLDRLGRAIGPLVASRAVYFIALLGLCAAYIQGGLTRLFDFNAAVAETQSFRATLRVAWLDLRKRQGVSL
jgi:hypothetical protein